LDDEERGWMLRRWLLKSGIPLSAYLGFPLGKAAKLLRDSQKWTSEEMKVHQERSLSALIRHCYDHVPYYRDLMGARGLRPEDFRSINDLAKLPYLTRETMREQGARLRADNYPDKICQFRRSGGTTGEPIKVAVDDRGRAFEVTAYLRGFEWMNYQLGNPMVGLFGGSLRKKGKPTLRDKIRDILLNERFLPAFELNQENVRFYVDTIREARGGVLVGYASAMMNLVEYMSRSGLQGSPLKSVICTADQLPDEWRKRISQVLDAPVFCYYGCGEVNSIAYECSGVDGYIVSEEFVILEVAVAEDSTRFQDQGRGAACVTTLFNYAMPLIRYLNGDALELARSHCESRRLKIAKLEGRVPDQLIATDGHMVTGIVASGNVFATEVPIWKYQLVQVERDKIIFHYVLSGDNILTPLMRDTLTTVLRKYLGEDMKISFVLGNFEVPPSGKHRLVINRSQSKG
jgi:phenylacetate-CoA ligase